MYPDGTGSDPKDTGTAQRAQPLGFGRVFTDHMVIARYTRDGGWGPHEVVKRSSLSLHPATAVLHYAQAIFDGFKAFRGVDGKLRVFRLGAHLERLRSGSPRLALPEIDVAKVRASILALLAKDGHLAPTEPGGAIYVRPVLFADEPFLGVRPADVYTLVVLLSPVGSYYDVGARPLRLWVEREHTRAAPGGLGAVKAAANYAASLAAAAAAKKNHWDQVLWLDAVERRFIEEVGTMNVFVQIDDELLTPALDGTILPGITRASAIALFREGGYAVTERKIALSEIEAAAAAGRLRGVFGTGTAAVVSPVGALGLGTSTIEVPTNKDASAWLLDRLTGIQRGRTTAPDGWIDFVDEG
ncbi:branched-chain amino acid aminotransferase [Myxococcota bacterium]|nr:branched-chain amino acid aminotransferase [Myxococcota bacterium]